MKTRIAIALMATACVGGAAQATRVAGIAGLPPRVGAAASAPAAPALRQGVVTAVRADGQKIEIDGKWLVAKAGRTQVLQKGLPVAASTLVKGQSVRYSLASETPGETALGVVYVP